MSELIPTKEFDNFSSYSFKSQLSNYQFSSPLPLPADPAKIPTNQQIGQSYDQIERSFPDVESDHLVQMLYDNLIAPKVPEKSFSQYGSGKFNHSYANASVLAQKNNKTKNSCKVKEAERSLFSGNGGSIYGQNEENLKKAQNWTQGDNRQHHLEPSIVPKRLATNQEQIKYAEKKLAAKAFCDRGYNLDNMKEEVWQTKREVLQLDKRRYKSISTAFITESYRKLENFLIEVCHRNIKPLIQPEMKALAPLLLHSRLKMDEQQYLTLRKFVKVTFDLGSVSLFEQQAVKLYIKIQQCLRGKIGKMRLDRYYQPERYIKRQILRSPGRYLNQRLEKETIWTKQLEFEFIDLMLEHKTLARSRDQLKKRYGINAVLNNCVQLKMRFLKIIRLAARRLQKIAVEHKKELPDLLPFDDEKVKILIRHCTAREARWALARFYKADNFDKDLTAEAILKVNQFCLINESSKQTPVAKHKELPINSATDKIKHNIKESRKLLHSVIGPSQKIGFSGDLLFLNKIEDNYQHIVSLEHKDKLHYFRKTGQLNRKGGFEYEEKAPELKALELQDGDHDSEQPVYLSDDDYVSDQENEG